MHPWIFISAVGPYDQFPVERGMSVQGYFKRFTEKYS